MHPATLNLAHLSLQMMRFGGAPLAQLLRLVAQNRSRFSHESIGPIGAFLSLKDTRWATAVEAAIGGLMDQFLCHNHEDCQLLRELARTVRYNVKVIIYSFDHAAYRCA